MTMSSDFTFEMAQALRRSHCDRSDQPHECIGTVTIKRGEVMLDCSLCGHGSDCPAWDSGVADTLSAIFRSAGIEWRSLDHEAKLAAIAAYKRKENA